MLCRNAQRNQQILTPNDTPHRLFFNVTIRHLLFGQSSRIAFNVFFRYLIEKTPDRLNIRVRNLNLIRQWHIARLKLVIILFLVSLVLN